MKGLKKRRVAISGSGNVALHCVEKLIQEQASVVSVSDSGGTLYFKEGIDQRALGQLKDFKFKKRGRLKDFVCSKAEFQAGESPWALECDIAIPCATENELDGDDARKLVKSGVEVVCEGANMPLTGEAIKYISEKKVLFLPAKAANAGGVAVSGFERSQNASHYSEGQETILSRLKATMIDIHGHCSQGVDKEEGLIPYKKGANIYAFKKLVHMTRSLSG
jgi:glutamate dehydrogenase (NADP+)